MAEEEKKPDVILSDGQEITFDKKRIKRKEIVALTNSEQTEDEANEIIGRFIGKDREFVSSLSYHDWQLLMVTMWNVIRRPIDPNSASGSTSQ